MKKALNIFIISAITFCTVSLTVFADIGSKPRAEIKVENPPECEYYIDLLYQPSRPENVRSNLDDNSSDKYNTKIVSILKDYKKDGWCTAYCHGTGAPMLGNIKPDDEDRTVFSYVAVPDKFRIIIATEEGDVKISDTIDRKTMEVSLTVDYEDMSFTTKPVWKVYAGQFAFTCSLTLLIELIILILFRFSLKENIVVFTMTNVFTQIVFSVCYSAAFIYGGTLGSLAAFIPLEIAVMLTEMKIYSEHLKGRSFSQRYLYAIAANLVTAVLTWVNMDYLSDIMFRLLRF